MKQLLGLIKQDFIILQRNQMITISIVVTFVYAGLFRLLAPIGNLDKLLILLVFNDPALLGFLFAGVMVLFEKSENTLQALAVSPLKVSKYILSKAIVLTIISLVCSFMMAVASRGWEFNYLHFIMATITSTLLFSFIGFIIVARYSNFNRFMIASSGIIILLMIPFLELFDFLESYLFIVIPSKSFIDLLSLSFEGNVTLKEMWFPYILSIIWCGVSYRWAVLRMTTNFNKQ